MKEHDIRPTDIFNEYLRLSRIDAETFFENSTKKSIDCPACGAFNSEYIFTKQTFEYQECRECQTLYQSPRPAQNLFDDFYINSPSSNFWSEQFFPHVAESRREKLFKPRCQSIIEQCKKTGFWPKTLMDVGAGYGMLLEEWQKISPATELLAIEPGESLSKICINKGFKTLVSNAENAHAWHNKADLLTCFEVIEHVYNPLEFMISLKNLVKPGQKILITGLCGDGFDIKILWKNSKNISPPHHINFMSVKGFEYLFKRAGFTDIVVQTPGQLDVDIVLSALRDVSISSDIKLSRFEYHLLTQCNEQQQTALQHFIASNKLSSHCWIWAQRPL